MSDVHTVSREIGGRTLTIETGRIARQAHGSVLVRYGETVVLVAATTAPPRFDDIDFFPLSVDYRERHSAAGKFPGGFIKREGRPTTKEILTARMIDRPIRPLFPDGYFQEVQICASVLSADRENDPDVPAMIGASAALSISKIPFMGPTGTCRLGRVNGEFVINPTHAQMEETDLNVLVGGRKEAINMLEVSAQELPEDLVADAIVKAHEAAREVIEMIEELQQKAGVEKETPVVEIDADRQDRATKRPRAQAGLAGQIERRRAEQTRRRWICQIAKQLLDLKATWCAIEVALGVCERVLRRWMKTINEPIVARGRSPKNVDIELWLALYFFMKAEGHNTGEPTLRKAFPDYPDGALRRDMRFFRDKLKQERKKRFRRLRWMRAGTVWAMDHGVAPGEGPTAVKDFLVVRDLASRQTLSAKSVPGQDTASTIEELSLLFSFYGRPLVIKADNGPAFVAKDMRKFLSDAGVVLMLSPVYMPSYNGGAERAVYDVKTFADHCAALYGRMHWTQEDLSWARERANRVVGKDMKDRTQRFEAGEEITAEERAAFLGMFEAEKIKSRRTMEQRNKGELNQRQMDTADRRACRNALVGSDFIRIEGDNSSSA